MRKLMMIGLAIVSLTFAGNVQAQNKRWSLQECIDHAIRHNIEVKQSPVSYTHLTLPTILRV